MAPYNRYTLAQLISVLTGRVGNNSTFWSHDEKRDAINEALNVWQLMVGEFTVGLTMAADGSTFYGVPTQVAAIQRIKFQPSSTTVTTTPASITLNNGIVSFWQLEEASGSTRFGSIGPNNLTDVNTVTQVTGKVGFGGGFTRASSTALRITDALQSGLNPGTGDFSLSMWVNPTSLTGTDLYTLIGKGGSGVFPFAEGYWIFLRAPGLDGVSIGVRFGDGVEAFRGCQFNGGPALSIGTWYHVVVTFDRDGNAILYVNGVSSAVAAMNNIGPSSGNCSPIQAFTIGHTEPAVTEYLDGKGDAIGYWNRILTPTEVGYLYNSGAGLQAPITSTSITTNYPLSPLTMISINELDLGDPGWQGTTDTPLYWALQGINLFALSPQPSSGVIAVEGISETPALINDSDYVMLGDEQLNRILDYAEHYCTFKEGVGEFDAAQSGFGLFVKAAAKRNSNLLSTALYRQWMGRNRQETEWPSEKPSPPVAR